MANDIVVDYSFPLNYIKSGFCGFSDRWYTWIFGNNNENVPKTTKSVPEPTFLYLSDQTVSHSQSFFDQNNDFNSLALV